MLKETTRYMDKTVAEKIKTTSPSDKYKKVKIYFDATTKSLLDIDMLRNNVTNYSGYIRAKLFKYPLDKIRLTPQDRNPLYNKLPDFMKKDAEFTDTIDIGEISQNIYDIISAYNEFTARYDRDRNSTLIRNRIETEKVIDNDRLENKFRELNYHMGELHDKYHALYKYINGIILRPYGKNWTEFPECIEEKLAKNEDEKTVPLSKYYAKIANKNLIDIKFNSAEFTELDRMRNEEGWMNYSGFIRRKVIGKSREYSRRISKIIYSNNIAEQLIILSNQAEFLAAKIKYSAYRYEKKMDEMRENEAVKKYRRESFVIKLVLDLLRAESKVESLLDYILRSHNVKYEEKPYFEDNSFEEENDLEKAQELTTEYNNRYGNK